MPAHKAGREAEASPRKTPNHGAAARTPAEPVRPPGGKIMSKDALLTLATPDRLVQLAELNRAQADRTAGAGAPRALELRHLRYFVALADAGSFTRAAEKIFVAQPTLSQQIRRLEEIVGTPLLQRRREGLRLTPAGRVLLDGSRTVLALADQEVNRTRQAAGLGRPRLRVAMPPGLPECLAVPATARLRAAAAAADVDLAWLETALEPEFSLISTRHADAGLGWLTGPQTVPAALEVMTVAEFEPEVWVPAAHTAARRGTISLEELVSLQVIHGPRRAQPGTYDAWVKAMQAVDPRFEFTDPPFRHSLAMTLALAAAGNRPAAVLTGPAIAARTQARPVRQSRLAGTYGMVRVSLQHHPLTAAAALVWSGDLPRPLQQLLFDTADSLTEPPHSQPADLISLTTA
jgi:DNA-binding transcriptional LysR family regulator